jgi:DegT/DnrJ/EryC1/StrS aminotransferase family
MTDTSTAISTREPRKSYGTRIPLYQWSTREHADEALANAGHSGWSFDSVRHEYWGPTGRWLIGAWLEHLNLDRTDVVTILTTSQERYVSICVSVTAFNHAAISRVLTDRTRVIIAIHEFGYVDTAFPSQCEGWQARGISVLEDCAYTAGIKVGSANVGDYGDAALFSLPKIIPANTGGLLRTRAPFRLPSMDAARSSATNEGKAAAQAYLPYVPIFNALREERHRLLRNGLGLPPWEPQKPTVSVPWFSMYTDPDQHIYKSAFPGVHWGTATLEADRLQIPTNPLVPMSEFKTVIDYVRSSGFSRAPSRAGGDTVT